MKKLAIVWALAGSSMAMQAQETFVNNAPAGQQATLGIPAGIIAGYITTVDGKPAAYVNIAVKETRKATTTNEQGFFSIRNIPTGSYTLEVSMTGLHTVQKVVDVANDKTTTIQLALTEDARQLGRVLVIARRAGNAQPVTIDKAGIAPMDLPQSIAIIGQGVIKDQQALRMGEVIKNVNGVYITGTRGGVQESFGARGYSFSSTNLYKNGFRINTGVMPEVSGLDKVEVLKGSGAILYGQVAPGGIVNMVTKQPRFQFGGEVGLQAGSYDLYKPTFDIYGPATATIAYRLNGSFESASSFRDVVHTRRYYVNPSLLVKLSNRTELLVEGDYLDHRFTPDFGIGTLDNTLIPQVPRSRYLGAVWSYNTTQQATATASLKHIINAAWRLEAAATYQQYRRDYYATERIQANAEGDWTRQLGKIDTKEAYAAAQLNMIGKLETGKLAHTLLAGVDADHTLTGNYDFRFPAVAGLPDKGYDIINILNPGKYTPRTDIPTATAIRHRQAPVNRLGIYLQDLVKISSTFNILAGVRWSSVQTVGIDSTNLQTGEQTQGVTTTNTAFSPRVGLVYKPVPTTSIYASYSNSFQTNSGTDIYGHSLTPSLIDQYEAGVKNDFFSGLLSANVTVYRIINNNLAQTAPYDINGNPNSNTAIKVLSGQTTSDGVELDLSGQPVKNLLLLAGYSYNYMRYTKTGTAKGNFIEGERLVDNPAHTANASVFYTFSNEALKGFKIGASANYVGKRYGGYNNTVGQSQHFSRLIPVKGYTLLDITAGYTYKKVSLLAKVSNLTNTLNYYVHDNYSINPIAPRQVVATVSYKL